MTRREILKRLLPPSIIPPLRNLERLMRADEVTARLWLVEQRLSSLAGGDLRHLYPAVMRNPRGLHELNLSEVKVYSQNGEDGILLYLLTRTGVESGAFIEIGCGDGRECNAANLAINFGCVGCMIDASPDRIEKARRFYGMVLMDQSSRVQLTCERIGVENINKVVTRLASGTTPDLLSIDIDGNDYWVWKALTSVQPTVVVIEYNASLGKDRSISTVYDPNFDIQAKHPSGIYHGASLAALAKLGKEKGYQLVGCDSTGVNAFFVRSDVARGTELLELTPEGAWFANAYRADLSTEDQWAQIEHMDYVEV